MLHNTVSTPSSLRVRARKPTGGYCFVPGVGLLAAWFAFRREIIELLDLRVWLACHELLARRCVAAKGTCPRYTLEELQVLVRSTSRPGVRRSLARLERAGLLIWSERGPVFGQGELVTLEAHDPAIYERIQGVPNIERRIPFPRRLLRELVQARRPVFLATAFGHLVRGLYFRGGQCVSGGRCKASWIADLFEVDSRNVKAARGELERKGWLKRCSVGQTALNRWGYTFMVCLQEPSRASARRSPPPAGPVCRQSPPPETNKKLLKGSENQEPARRRPAGSSTWNIRVHKPCFTRVSTRDLEDSDRLNVLYDQAVVDGCVRRTRADLLNFFAAAEHARTVGTKNACGLFVTLVRKRLWSFISLRDEDAARRRLALLEEQNLLSKRDGHGEARSSPSKPIAEDVTDRLVIRELIRRSLASTERPPFSGSDERDPRSGGGRGGGETGRFSSQCPQDANTGSRSAADAPVPPCDSLSRGLPPVAGHVGRASDATVPGQAGYGRGGLRRGLETSSRASKRRIPAAGSTSQPLHHKQNSATSTRRSAFSHLKTHDCGFPMLAASSRVVNPASSRIARRSGGTGR